MVTRATNEKLLKSLIRRSGLRIKDLAQEIGVSESLLSKLSRGCYNFVPKEDKRIQICEYFQVTVDALFPLLAQRKKKKAA